MGKAGRFGDKAITWAPQRTIPTSRKTVSVAPTGSQNLKSVVADDGPNTTDARDLRGFWIYLSASGGDVTIQMSNAPNTAGKGFVIVAGAAPQEFFIDPGVDPDAEVTLHGAGTAAELHILWDDAQVT